MFSAYRVSLCGALSIMVVGMILFQTFPQAMLMLFADKSNPAATAELLSIGIYALRTVSWAFVGVAFGIINMTMFQATGHGVATLIVSICRQIVVLVPCAWLLGQLYGLPAVWWAFPISEFISFVISSLLLYRADRTEFRFLDTPKEG